MLGRRNVIVDVEQDERYPHEVVVRDVKGARGEHARIAGAVAETAEWQADGSAYLPSYIDDQGMNITLRSKRR
jgi:hypothetical protein